MDERKKESQKKEAPPQKVNLYRRQMRRMKIEVLVDRYCIRCEPLKKLVSLPPTKKSYP